MPPGISLHDPLYASTDAVYYAVQVQYSNAVCSNQPWQFYHQMDLTLTTAPTLIPSVIAMIWSVNVCTSTLHWIYKINYCTLNSPSALDYYDYYYRTELDTNVWTRGHSLKLKKSFHTELCQHFLSECIINLWNSTPQAANQWYHWGMEADSASGFTVIRITRQHL